MLACANVGGLKLESRITRFCSGRVGRRGAGTLEVWGRVQRMRNESCEDWNDVRARENDATSDRASSKGILEFDEFLALMVW